MPSKAQRPDFSCLIGCEEILFPTLLMGGDGGTIATSGVVPEVVMKLYNEFLNGNLDEAKRIQFKLLDLINAMLYGTNFPEGFRAGMSLRGFNLGTTRQLLSPGEKSDLEGLTAILEATDVMLKAANVTLVGKEKIGAAYVTVMIRGNVAAVQAAVDAGAASVDGLGKLIAAHVIARPHHDLLALLPKGP